MAPPIISIVDLRRADCRADRAWWRPWRRRRSPSAGAAGLLERLLAALRARPASRARHRRAADGASAFGRGMGAVRGRKGVVDVDIAERAPAARRRRGSLFSSPAWKRVFSRQRMSPSFIAATARSAAAPMQSSAKATGRLTMLRHCGGDRLQRILRDRGPSAGRNARAGSPWRPCRRARGSSAPCARCGWRR